MESTEPINSTLEEKFMAHSRLEKDKDQGYRNVVQQSIYEEKLANNGLYASIFMHFFVILSTLVIILFKTNLISIYHDNDTEAETINFSLFQFSLQHLRNKSQSYSYFCIESTKEVLDDQNNTKSVCIVSESCTAKGLNTTMIMELFEFDCNVFVEFKFLGIVVKNY
jgi:hypothetical protein